ncbi:hypothetical protein Clacol_002590 [Clathrus columnatus]|uniref:EthD domain-containing protein n=1 Tax=Clathrus columnatus TaxID=1419009 RepID=A0AAV5A736_9AGAM|nr:hypothetical protein Clacol_002590 [Clathrus columnatus]
MTDATPIGTSSGILHVLMDIGPNVSEEEFHQWYNNEHGPSRMAIEGFKCGVRYEALDGLGPKWVATYEIDNLTVLQTEPYLSIRNNSSPEEADILKRISLIDRKIYADVLHRGQFQPVIGTILVAVRLLIPSANAKELEEWYQKEHVDMLADIPGWLRSRLFKELSSESSKTDLVQYMALHEYHSDNGLGGPKHVAASSTDWRMRIMSLAIGGPIRRDFRLYHIF